MFTTGLAIFLGLVFVLAKLRRRLMLRLLHHDALLDITVTVLVLYVHWGSFEGVMAATIAAFYQTVPVGHVEAGLRSGNLLQPWPEEANRRVTDAIAAAFFAQYFTPGKSLKCTSCVQSVAPCRCAVA